MLCIKNLLDSCGMLRVHALDAVISLICGDRARSALKGCDQVVVIYYHEVPQGFMY